MTTFIAPLEHFLDDASPTWSKERELCRATRAIDVYRTENYNLVRVCSLGELRVAVATASMAMAAFALEKVLGASGAAAVGLAPDASISLGLSSELSDLRTLQHAVAQGESPLLIEGCLEVWKAGFIPSWHGPHYSHLWPKGTPSVPGYKVGVEGLIRMARVCWTEGAQWFDTTEHGMSSVLPRTKEAMKHLRVTHGIPVVHEKAILSILEQLQKSWMHVFLESSA